MNLFTAFSDSILTDHKLFSMLLYCCSITEDKIQRDFEFSPIVDDAVSDVRMTSFARKEDQARMKNDSHNTDNEVFHSAKLIFLPFLFLCLKNVVRLISLQSLGNHTVRTIYNSSKTLFDVFFGSGTNQGDHLVRNFWPVRNGQKSNLGQKTFLTNEE